MFGKFGRGSAGHPQQIGQHQNLAVGILAGADAYRRNADFIGNASGQRSGNPFDYHRKYAGVLQSAGIGQQALRAGLIAPLHRGSPPGHDRIAEAARYAP